MSAAFTVSQAEIEEIRVLHVDDEPDFAEMAAAFIQREDDRFTIETATGAGEALDRLDEGQFDCIVSDYDMPRQNGIDFLKAVRETHPDLPFVLFTGKGSEEIASEAISAGVTDYLQKNSDTSQYAVLANRINNVVEQFRSRQAHRETEQKLSQLAEQTDDILFMFTGDWSELLFINSAYEDIWGASVEELREDPESFLEYIHPDDRSAAIEAMEHLASGESIDIEYRVIRPDGEQRWIHGKTKPIFDEDGAVSRIVGYVRDITDRKEREREHRQEQQFMEQSIDALQDALYAFDTEGNLLLWNSTVVDLTGYTDDEIAEMAPTDFFPEDQQERIVESVHEVLETGTSIVEADILTKDGERVPFEFRGTKLIDSDGTVLGFAGVGRDISKRKEREEGLEQARELLEHTERIADVGGWEIDTDTMDVFWTDHLFDILGVDYEEEPPLDEALDIYHEDDRPIVETAVEQALDSGEPFDIEARFQQPDGELRWLQISGKPSVENGAVVTLRGAVQDITDRKIREERLRETTTRIEALFDNSPDMIDVLNPDGTILDVNRRFCEELGYDEDDVLGRPIWEIDQLVDAEDVTTLLSDFSLDERRKFEGRYERQDGSTFPVEVHLLRLNLDGENRFLAISRDITERKAREQQLEQQNEQLEEFAGVVSHDLRNPLNVANGRLELAQEECESEHHDAISTALNRMERIIDDVLWLAREGRDIGSTDEVDLNDAIETAWTMVADDSQETKLIVADELKSIEADDDRLSQLLENLFRNAVEHGGENVTVTVGELDDGFYIEDDGPGIPENEREEVFAAGHSTSEEGTGFGLSIVRKIGEAHGWEIRVTEGADGGARFEITGVEFSAE